MMKKINKEKALKVKRVLLITFIVPYLILGAMGGVQLYFLCTNYVDNAVDKMNSQDRANINNIIMQMDNLENEINQISTKINMDGKITALQNIKKNEGYYLKSKAVNQLSQYYIFNPYIEEVLIHFTSNDIYIKNQTIRNVQVITQEYGLKDITEQQLNNMFSEDYKNGRFLNISGKYFYIVSIRYGNNRMNLIYKIDDVLLNANFNNYEHSLNGFL